MSRADHLRAATPADHRALIQAVLLHVGVLGVVLLLPYLHATPKEEPPRVVEAVLVRSHAPAPAKPAEPVTPPAMEVPAPEPVPRPEPVKKAPLPEPVKIPPKIPLPVPKPLPAPRVEPAKAVPEKAVTKPEPVKPVVPAVPKPLIKKQALNTSALDAEMKALEKQTQQEEVDRAQKSFEKSMQASRATANLAIRDKYQGLINQRVVTKWNRPLSARNGMVTTLRVSVLPGGEVANVMTSKSSGNSAFDASAEEAVRRSSPLPVPDDVAVFNQYFRVITIKFNPEDL
ncbi:MAG: cell envelope integrity protein TolA [bacterium]|nr:cell envelope integrity protein TolA [bacterium]